MNTRPVVRNWIRLFLWLMLAVMVCPGARAWTSDGKALWPDGVVKVNVRLGESPVYADGNTPNTAANERIIQWNKYMKRVQLEVTKLPAGTGAEGDNSNDVFFASSWNGVAIPSTVYAMTIVRTSGAARVEADIVVNSSLVWDSFIPWWQVKPEIGRIIAHETGHLLGLGDSDTSFSYKPIMRSEPSEFVNPQIDDVEGIAWLYGAGLGFEPPLPTSTGVISDKPYQVTAEEKTSLTLVVSYPASTYTYQWYKDGVAIAGATSQNYSVASVQAPDAGLYQVDATGFSGTARMGRYSLTITPRRAPAVSILTAPAASLTATEPMFFSAYATGSTPLSYQWQKDGVDIVGATSSTYSVASVALADAGVYRVVATNDVGSAMSGSAAVAVKAMVAPAFTSQPVKTVYLVEGDSRALVLAVTPPVSTQWQWYKEGVLLSANSGTYTFAGKDSEVGNYTVKASNTVGALSYDFAVAISPKPPLSSVQVSTSASPVVGSRYTFTCGYSSTYSYNNTYQWYKDGLPLSGQTGSSLTIDVLKQTDAGDYYVVVKNAQGRVTSKVSSIAFTSATLGVAVGWVRPQVYAGVSYILQSNPSAVLRYDLAKGVALSPLSLSVAATQLCVGRSGVFIGNNAGEVYCCPPGSSTFALLRTFSSAVLVLANSGDRLFCLVGNSLYDLAVSTNTLSVPQDFIHYSTNCGIIIADSASSLIVWDDAINNGWYGSKLLPLSWSNVSRFSTEGGGLRLIQKTSSLGGARVYLRASGASFLSSAGTTWDMATLTSTGSFPFAVEDHVVVDGEQSLALRSGKAYLLDSSLVPKKSLVVPAGTVALCASKGVCYTLQQGPQGSVIYTALNLDDMKVFIPQAPVLDKAHASGPSDYRFVDKNDLLWTVNVNRGTLVAWSPVSQAVVKAILLRGDVYSAVYSRENHCIYLSYTDGLVTEVDLSKEDVAEVWYKMVDVVGRNLSVAGSLLIVSRSDFRSDVYDAQAQWVSQFYSYLNPSMVVWDAELQVLSGIHTVWYYGDSNRFYYYTMAAGVFTEKSVVPATTSHLLLAAPVRLGGGSVLLGSGQLCDLDGTTLKASLPRGHVDAQYVNGAWFTLYSTLEGCLVNKWDSALGTVVKAANLIGQPVALFPLSGNRLLVLGDRYGSPRYTILDDNLKVISSSGSSTPSRLANLSVQADAGVGMDALVPGFVLNGTAPKTLLLRGAGPGLAAFGVPNCLVDPTLTLYTSAGGVLDTNDNWGDLAGQRELRERSADLYAFTLAQGSKDAVLLDKLTPGAYSAQVQGVNTGVGRALVEIYDAEEAPGDSRAVNLSARCKISKGHEAVGGFVIQGDKPMTLLIRAVGPGLIKYSVTGTSADPKLRVFSGSQVIAENNDWSADPNQAATLLAAFASTGAFALDTGSKDAALLVTLQPGSYTVYMESADGGSGVSILEFYEAPAVQ